MMLEDRLIKIMLTNNNLMRDLQLVQQLKLPNWCIAAGYIRNYVWDYLHGYSSHTRLNDVDVLYFDPNHLSEDAEKDYEAQLKHKIPEYNWSCKNQARMHIRNDEEPYHSVADAMKRWPETATAVGVSFSEDIGLKVIAPHGLTDLFDLVIRMSPFYMDKKQFYRRVESKNWLNQWPKLRLIDEIM